MTTEPTTSRPCLTCGRPHGVDGWNPRHPARYYEPTRPVADVPHGSTPEPKPVEREFKFTTTWFASGVEAALKLAGFEPITVTHIYPDATTRYGRRIALDGSVTYIRTVKAPPPADIPPGTPLVRDEENFPLNPERFAEVSVLALTGQVSFLTKRRYDVPLDDGSGLVCEVDIYAWPPDAPPVFEVEVPEGEDRYVTPDDLPAVLQSHHRIYEVTQDPDYYAANMAARLPA
jgi:hypothetical protein